MLLVLLLAPFARHFILLTPFLTVITHRECRPFISSGTKSHECILPSTSPSSPSLMSPLPRSAISSAFSSFSSFSLPSFPLPDAVVAAALGGDVGGVAGCLSEPTLLRGAVACFSKSTRVRYTIYIRHFSHAPHCDPGLLVSTMCTSVKRDVHNFSHVTTVTPPRRMSSIHDPR